MKSKSAATVKEMIKTKNKVSSLFCVHGLDVHLSKRCTNAELLDYNNNTKDNNCI